jgi:hypothetical protein
MRLARAYALKFAAPSLLVCVRSLDERCPHRRMQTDTRSFGNLRAAPSSPVPVARSWTVACIAICISLCTLSAYKCDNSPSPDDHSASTTSGETLWSSFRVEHRFDLGQQPRQQPGHCPRSPDWRRDDHSRERLVRLHHADRRPALLCRLLHLSRIKRVELVKNTYSSAKLRKPRKCD